MHASCAIKSEGSCSKDLPAQGDGHGHGTITAATMQALHIAIAMQSGQVPSLGMLHAPAPRRMCHCRAGHQPKMLNAHGPHAGSWFHLLHQQVPQCSLHALILTSFITLVRPFNSATQPSSTATIEV